MASSESLIWRTRLRNRPERPKDRSHDCIQRETRVDSDKWDVYIVANPTNPAVTRQDSSQRPDRISYRTDNPSIEKVIIDHFASQFGSIKTENPTLKLEVEQAAIVTILEHFVIVN